MLKQVQHDELIKNRLLQPAQARLRNDGLDALTPSNKKKQI